MINITLPDNSTRQFEAGVTGIEIANSISPRLAQDALAISVNGEVQDLTLSIKSDAHIQIHLWDSQEGKSAFWHSSAHLMAQALEHIYPGIKLGIGPSIENGFYYDVDLPAGAQLNDSNFKQIEDKFLELARQKNDYVRKDISKTQAIEYYTKKNDEYKLELLNELEDGTITFYTHGDFTDLCRGPHLPNTDKIKAFKILSIAGAYWRGDETRKQLVRIYGISFPKQKMLDEYLIMLEEAKKRDHRKIGKELGLFTFSSKVGLGLPLWLPKGTELRKRLETWLTKELKQRGYQFVMTPHIGNVELYKTSGHYEKYRDSSFREIDTPQEGEAFMLKPMNCPHHVEIFASEPHSYKDLPIRMAEFGTVYRYEQHGELHGLTRVRSFTQDDAHVFCAQDQVKEEFKDIIDLIIHLFKSLGFEEYTAQISLRDTTDNSKYIGDSENWEKAEKAIQEAATEMGLKPILAPGEAAFYGPKLDFVVKDAIGRNWQLSTIQVDYNLPERFNLTYIGSDNQKHRPIMLHRAIFGSMERFVAVLIENTAGKFPLWLTPEQAVILPVSDKFNDYAKKVSENLKNYDIRTRIDDRNEKVGRKIRDNELLRIPYILVVGEKEEANGEVSVRKQGEGDKGAIKINDFVALINNEIKEFI